MNKLISAACAHDVRQKSDNCLIILVDGLGRRLLLFVVFLSHLLGQTDCTEMVSRQGAGKVLTDVIDYVQNARY